ncbi:MAG: leucine-rich repeat domain-containing protein [Oscillospiraceae bacterium]|nr:leucine-rich repeat domain-containing protein [Oscillospiraceae bacterium]
MAKFRYDKKKKRPLAKRILIFIIAVALLLGIIIMAIPTRAEGNVENLTVQSFETGKLADAISKAANGTDYNFIKNIAVLSGTLNAEDYSALLTIPNLEIIELAGTETEGGIIPENALPSRNQLTVLTLPKNTVEIGKNAFSGNRKLVKVLMPATVTKIDDYAFAACEALEEVPVSAAVTYIGEGAFQDCKAITEFVIPAGISELYPNTFSKCGFESISIGPDVKKIGGSVFADCNNLKDIYAYGETAPALDSDVFRNVSAAVHCYEDSEESYESWKQNNITITADLTGEYSLKAEISAENSETYEAASAETEAENDENDEAQAEASEEEAVPAQGQTDTQPAQADQSAQSGGLSVGVVIVIVIMAMIIAVLATVLVMMKKGGKS